MHLLRSPVYGSPALGANTFAHLCIHNEMLNPAYHNTQALVELVMYVCVMFRYSPETGNLTGTSL